MGSFSNLDSLPRNDQVRILLWIAHQMTIHLRGEYSSDQIKKSGIVTCTEIIHRATGIALALLEKPENVNFSEIVEDLRARALAAGFDFRSNAIDTILNESQVETTPE